MTDNGNDGDNAIGSNGSTGNGHDGNGHNGNGSNGNATNRRVTTILNGSRPEGRRLAGASQGSSNLGDLLERVLDKGIIIAGDITLCLGEIELLQIKIRLLVASVDKARDMGIDWWQHDPALSSAANKAIEQRDQLAERLDRLETMLTSLVHERAKERLPFEAGA